MSVILAEVARQMQVEGLDSNPSATMKGLLAVLATFSTLGATKDGNLEIKLCFHCEAGAISQELYLAIRDGNIVVRHPKGYAIHNSEQFQAFCKTLGIESIEGGSV
ncbi:MAG: hypothetical protein AAB410_02750 [Patescibacteria group bacterium]